MPFGMLLNIHAVPLFCVGLLIFFTGLYIFFQNPRSIVHLAFLLICLSLDLWFIGIPFVYTAPNPVTALAIYRGVVFLGITLIAPCVYLFTTSWLGIIAHHRARVGTCFAVCLAFYLAGFATPYGFTEIPRQFWGFYPKYGPASAVFVGFFFLILFGCVFLYLRAYFREPQGLRKTQIRLIALAFFIAFLGSVDYVTKLAPVTVYPFGFVLVFMWIVLVAYAIIRYKVMNIDTVIHKTVMWVLSTILVVVPFAGLLYTVQEWIFSGSPVRRTLGGLLAGIVFIFYFRSIQPRLDHVFQRRRMNLQKTFEKFSYELAQLKDMRDLLQSFCRLLRRSLYVSQVSIYLRGETGEKFVPVIAKRIRGLKPVPASHPFLEFLEKVDEPALTRLVVGHPELESHRDAVEQYLRDMQAVLVVPFVLGGKLIGLAHLGKKFNLRKFFHDEIHFLSQLRAPLAIAFSNSVRFEDIRELSEELRRWNEELERRVEDRTRELVKTQEQLVQAEKLATLGTLAGGVAHEINNPLTAVLTNAQILRMSAREDDIESISLIEEGAKRCQGIVQKLMKYARKTAEETPHKDVNLADVVKGTVALLGFQFQQENVEVVMKLADTPPVKGIAGELEQVLTNLLVNAKDAVRAVRPPESSGRTDLRRGPGHAQGRILVETRKTDGAVELLVSDNGIGIPKENLKKIFDPFFTTKDVGAGTGLGLSVSFGILKRHGAAITAQSEPGQGSVFTIRFPKEQKGTVPFSS